MAIKNSSNIITHKRALAMFLAALMVATVFGIMGTAAGTPHDSKFLVTNPVIFVHGYFGSSDDMLYPWTNMMQALDNAGYVKGMNYFVWNYNSKEDPRIATTELQNFIKDKEAFYFYQYGYDHVKFTIVCHSLGAMVSRWYIEKLGGAENVSQWIGIGPGNHGVVLADMTPELLLTIFNSNFGKVCVDSMKTNSDMLRELKTKD